MAELTRNTARWTAVDTKDNATATATKVGVTGIVHCLTGISASVNGLPATALTVQVRSGNTVIDEYRLPAEIQGPLVVNYNFPIECGSGETVSVSVNAAGNNVVTAVTLRGFSIMGK